MPRKRRTEDSTNDRELTRTFVREALSTWLLTSTGDQVLALADQPLTLVTTPPLAFYIWQQLDYLREKGGRLGGWVKKYADVGLTSLQAVHLPVLSPAFTSLSIESWDRWVPLWFSHHPTLGKRATLLPMWWQMLDLVWLRRHLRGKNQLVQAIPVIDEKWPVNDTNENRWADEFYPMVIKNLFSQPVARELPYTTTDDLVHQTYVTPVPLQTNQVYDGLEIEDTSASVAPHIRGSKIPGTYLTNQIQKSSRRRVKDAKNALAPANWQPHHTYQNRWLDQVWASFIQRLVPRRLLMKSMFDITRQGFGRAYTTPVQYQSYLTASRAEIEPGSRAGQQPTLPYMANTAEAITLGEGAIHTLENYGWLVALEKKNNLLYPLPGQSEPPMPGAALKRPGQSTIPKTTSRFKETPFSLPMLNREQASEFLFTMPTLRRAPEISQARWSLPLVNPLPEIARQRTETAHVSENSGSMIYRPVTVGVETPDSVSLSRQEGQTETSLISGEPVSVAGLGRQPSPVTESIYQTPASPSQQYFKSVGNTPPPNRSENYNFLWNQDYEPSYPRYEDVRQPVLELPPTSIIEPGISARAARSVGSLPVAFVGTTYYGSQLTQELALAPVGRPAEAESPTLSEAESKIEEEMKEVATPDIDDIARDVYSILKRRLARERERALGLS